MGYKYFEFLRVRGDKNDNLENEYARKNYSLSISKMASFGSIFHRL